MAGPRRVLARRFGLGRAMTTPTHVRVRSQPFQTKLPTLVDDHHESETEDHKQKQQQQQQLKQLIFDDEDEVVKQSSRRIMVVVEQRRRNSQAKSALKWALTHTVQSEDIIVLLLVTKLNNPSKHLMDDESSDSVHDNMSPRVSNLLCSMKKICQMERPELIRIDKSFTGRRFGLGSTLSFTLTNRHWRTLASLLFFLGLVRVEVAVVDGSEKGAGPAIVEESKKQGISMLVLGQRKRSIFSRVFRVWKRRKSCGSSRGGVVEYCIQNANCMTIAVRRKSRKLGGYLITTRHHNNFWLLA